MYWDINTLWSFYIAFVHIKFRITYRNRRGRDSMIHMLLDLQLPMQLVIITTKVVNSNPANGAVYSKQHYVIKFVSGFRRFPPPIKLIATIYLM